MESKVYSYQNLIPQQHPDKMILGYRNKITMLLVMIFWCLKCCYIKNVGFLFRYGI